MIGGTIDIPKVGSVPKIAVFGIGGVALAYIGWRYYQARSSASSDTTVDPGFDDPGTLPGVAGAVSDTNQYGATTGGTGGDAGTGVITTNAQWSQDAESKLLDSYAASDIVAALGNYLGGQPLSDAQQTIVRSAIAVSGYPPVGSFSIVSGGNTALTLAPSGVNVGSVAATSVAVNFTEVAGAKFYKVAASNGASATGASSPIVLSGLSPNTSYSVTVTGYTASNTAGPTSAAVSFKTAAGAAPAAVGGLHATRVTANEISLDWNDAAGSRGYDIQWTDPKGAVGNATTLTSSYNMINLPRSYRYQIKVRGKNDVGSTTPGPWSNTIQVTTKSK